MLMESSLLCVHLLHVLLCHLNLSARIFNILIIFVTVLLPVLALLLAPNLHVLLSSFNQATEDVEAVTGTGTTILN